MQRNSEMVEGIDARKRSRRIKISNNVNCPQARDEWSLLLEQLESGVESRRIAQSAPHFHEDQSILLEILVLVLEPAWGSLHE